ncbi:uncharacterized protein PAC_06053 [Phialocephala subalpina]|uniref:Uncharacterized protein n=1 Tax=Phialocephala subalpina TaxID=576137 RepID=A0A1L7WTQ4_9HELO|nr:uncharacterized protein PAC_06053 [Phialocephala subalpina]
MAAPGPPPDPTPNPDTDPNKYSFKGHPQPSVNDRLETAKNFLADEDPDRFLNFDDKITEIEEFIADVESKPHLIYDAAQLRDVKIMLEEQRDWQKTVDDGWKDIKCRDRVPKNPFSNRLINADTIDLIKEEGRAFGTNGQMRDDAPPFTTEREDDHDDFLRAMRSDVLQNPDDVDETKNLLYIEGKAYSWAMQDPAFIPFWMHPTKGIPKKGLTDVDDIPWYKIPPPPPDYIKNRPNRGYIPDYLVKREDRINALLKVRKPTPQQFKELEDLLTYHYPNELKILYDQYLDFLETVGLDTTVREPRKLTKEENKEMDRITAAFQDAQSQWLQSFINTGVYLVVRKPWNEVEVDLPGVFYVDEGVLSDSQIETLEKINTLLNDLVTNNYEWRLLNPTQKRQFEVLVHDFQPEAIRNIEKQRDDILLILGVDSPEELENFHKAQWLDLDTQADAARELWLQSAKGQLQLEFRYLRPGEIPEADPNVIYLPWSLDSMPDGKSPNMDLKIPAEVCKLQTEINKKLKNPNLSKSIGDDGDADLQNALIQVAYPKLQRLLIPWITIGNKRAANQILSTIDEMTFNAIDSEVRKLWNDWVSTLGTDIKIKIARCQMQPETPDVLYWRLPATASGDPEILARRNTKAINDLLQTDLTTDDPTVREKFVTDAETLLADLQYPALKKAWDDYEQALKKSTEVHETPKMTSVVEETHAGLKTKWWDKFQTWIYGKLGHTISIKRPLPFFHPDDDPQVVYFHGPLTDTRATKKIRDRMDLTKIPEEVIQQLGEFRNVYGVGDLVPIYIKYLQRCLQDSGSPLDKIVLEWHSDYLLRGPLADTGVIDLTQETSFISFGGTSDGIWRNTYIDKDGVVKKFKMEPDGGGRFVIKMDPSSETSTPNISPTTSEASDLTSSSAYSNASMSTNASKGYHTRAPPRQFPVHPDLDLMVDLEQFRPHIAAVESELEDLLSKMRAERFTTVSSAEWLRRRKRIGVLLNQFMPDDVYKMRQKVDRLEEILRLSDETARTSRRCLEQERQLHQLRNETARRYANWLQQLERSHNGVYVQLSTKPEDTFDGMALIFNPGVTGRDTSFQVYAPRDLSAPIGTSEIVEHKPPNIAAIDVYHTDRAFKQRMLPRLKDRINLLLAKRRNEEHLNREDSEELLDKLLGFMPLSLFKLESDLWELDVKVRDIGTPRNIDDEMQFEHLNQLFNSRYDSWLDSFPRRGAWVSVKKGVELVQEGGVLYLEDPNFWQYWTVNELNAPIETLSSRRPRRSCELPKHLKARLEMVKQYFAGTLPADKEEEVEFILKVAYRHVGRPLRDKITDEKLLIPFGQSLRPEEDVLVETTQAMAFLHWKAVVKRFRMEHGKRLDFRITEFGHGRYYTYFGPPLPTEENLTSPYPPGIETHWDPIANDIIDCFWDQLETTRTRFLAFAGRVRNQSRLTADEINFLRSSLLGLVAKDKGNRLDTVIGLLTRKGWYDTPLKPEEIIVLDREYQNILIENWARKYPGIVGQAASMPVLRTVDRLIGNSRAGEPPCTGVPNIATPSESEVRELEIEINNLLTRERSNSLQPREQEELEYLLRALLPPSLQVLKQRFDRLHENYVTLPGLTMNESIEYLEYRQRYQQEFAIFKQSVRPWGIFLDKWWYTIEAIAETCSRARLWKEATEKDAAAGTYPTTSVSLENTQVGQWHSLYQELRTYVDSNTDNAAVSGARETRLLFRFMPADLVTLGEEIRDFKQRANNKKEGGDNNKRVRELAWVEDVISKFVRLWIQWVTSMPPSQLESLRSAAGGNLGPNIAGNVGGGGRLNTRGPANFSSKAERRGIKRAAIELALNLLATNQEQHRPLDIYRNLDLPGKYYSIDEGVPLCLPLEPWQRPVELDPFHYTKKLTAFHQLRDSEYSIARTQQGNSHPSELPVPANYMGPIAPADKTDVQEAKRRWLTHLAQVNIRLQHANLDAPRPLLQDLLLCYVGGSNPQRDPNDIRDQAVELTIDDVNLLNELAEPSWDEVSQEYSQPTPNTTGYAAIIKQQQDDKSFEQELNALDWSGRTWQPRDNWNATDSLAQLLYQQDVDSVQGYMVTDLTQAISNARLAKAKAAGDPMSPLLISEQEATERLGRLQGLRRIHLNQRANSPFETLIAKIPLSGHPENKYIVSRDAVRWSPGIFFDTAKGEYQVRYTACGKMGPPIVQPNKYEHLRSIAYRIGRDTSDALKTRSAPNQTSRQLLHEKINAQYAARQRMLPDGKDEEVLDMALELHRIAPYLAPEHAITVEKEPLKLERPDAAMLLQMQMLEEISNAWEPRFPEQPERLWDFADDRVAPQTRTINGRTVQARRRITQFFDVRRFPACCQDTATKAAIAKSGPQLQTQTSTATTTTTASGQQTAAQQQAEAPKKNVRHIQGQRPHFPFGETPYQQAYQSFCMEWDLADVPEFQAPPAPRRGLFTKRPSPEPADPFALPPIPPNWNPDNISAAEKRAQLIEAAKNLPGFPNGNILENYHTPAEIRAMKQREAFDRVQNELECAQKAIVKVVNKGKRNKKDHKTFAQVTPQEFSMACDALKIDKQTGRFRPNDPNEKKIPEEKPFSIWSWLWASKQGSTIVPEKEDERKKWQDEQDAGDVAANEGDGATPEEQVKQETQDGGPVNPLNKTFGENTKWADVQPTVEDAGDEDIKQEASEDDGASKAKGSNKRAAPPFPRRASPRKKSKKC